ncbi:MULTISPECIES: ABC transporter ATP-binding protein [unclassified Achromobacter]|uniref:ABC transporter ATP-binding protein n=1 Tax=unclassified Achromobacter TaxID=2626865 RepID=UPI000B51E5E2|nr:MULTISPECIES: ABC transporter ATP-binding protein [unclassified Achromobacter]OWT81088.1 Fe3+/spermidine/putrescine ABC transporter ATP-binding protein [Achromobacter sp. HZ34]OWT82589.1 Fe3+/spermidine/putrescine ABC transporter ATP-binding protein [Achromobacter sp. HZ28]
MQNTKGIPAHADTGAPARIGASLTLSAVHKQYGNANAVHGVDLDIQPGEFVTLLGSSGSGKTTTLMMIAGFTDPTSGEIRIDGKAINGTPPAKRNLGVVFQNYSLFPHLTVRQNVSFPLEMRGVGKSERERLVGQALEMVHLPDKAGSYPRQLSGGQQQRVALARALVFSPRVLLMDEPLGALDKKLREHMQMEIKRIQGELGATVVYVTHDQEEALTMSDRIAVMQAGRIVQIGRPADLYDRPATHWVADFVGQSNFIRTRVVNVGVANAGTVVALPGGGTGVAQSAAALSTGAAATLVLRPEKLRIGQADPTAPSENCLTGTVSEVVYLGHATRRTVRLADGTAITVQEANRSGAGLFEPGQQVAVRWAPEDGWLLPGSPDHEAATQDQQP